MQYKNLEELIEVVRILRSENGCPWDREQTHTSLRPNMIEEAYEAVDAIDEKDSAHLREELGDVLLQVLLHSQIASEHNEFTLDDVAKELKDKLIHRHPHVFGNAKVNSADDVVVNWDKLKQEEIENLNLAGGNSNNEEGPEDNAFESNLDKLVDMIVERLELRMINESKESSKDDKKKKKKKKTKRSEDDDIKLNKEEE